MCVCRGTGGEACGGLCHSSMLFWEDGGVLSPAAALTEREAGGERPLEFPAATVTSQADRKQFRWTDR